MASGSRVARGGVDPDAGGDAIRVAVRFPSCVALTRELVIHSKHTREVPEIPRS
jgi:hypothetical protein